MRVDSFSSAALISSIACGGEEVQKEKQTEDVSNKKQKEREQTNKQTSQPLAAPE